MNSLIYIGLKASSEGRPNTRTVFRSDVTPTFATHGHLFNATIGPFRTMRAARFMRDFGEGNPHCRCVAEAEQLARKYSGIPDSHTGRLVGHISS